MTKLALTYLLRGVWTPLDNTFLDIRVSHPNCLSNRTKTLQEVYEKNEKEKKDEYLERVSNMEKGTFTPAVFLTSGGMSKECKRFVNRVADLIARKRKERYCDVVRHVRTRIRNANFTNNTHCLTRLQRQENGQ